VFDDDALKPEAPLLAVVLLPADPAADPPDAPADPVENADPADNDDVGRADRS
jgi:hypothetical protein